MIPISVVILTHNEEKNLPHCLKSLSGMVQSVDVVDSGSTDSTRSIAEASGARVVVHPFESHARQWNWALENLPFSTDWILGIDADHRVTPELLAAMETFLKTEAGVNGAYVVRREVFLGRWIRHGGYYPKHLLKLFRKGFARADENDLVDHHFRVNGPVVILKGDLIEDNLKEHDLFFWMSKHVHYAMLQAEQEHRGRPEWNGRLMGNPDERVQKMKSHWVRMPLFLRSFLYFCYRYFVLLGLLDGIEGLIFHGFQAFWYRFLVDIRLTELRSPERR